MNILENNFHIAMTEKVKQEVDEMCNLSQGVREDGRKEGREEERIKNVKAIMKNVKVSAQEAMKMLDVPSEEQKKLLTLL
ncbi:MAG: hypothetical protein ACI3WU_06420 [Phascolarctobacterium sp.]